MEIDDIKNKIINQDDWPLIEKAYNFANDKLIGLNYINGETLIDCILKVVDTLIEFKADNATIISCLLYELINQGIRKENIEQEFDASISIIALRTSIISSLELSDNKQEYETFLTETLVNTPEDVRCLFIKLAERLLLMRTMQHNTTTEYQKKIAQETLDLLVPTASRLGLNFIRSQIEELCLFYLEPEIYNTILERLKDSPTILNNYLNDMKDSIANLLKENNIEFTIKGRVKNIYSIYNKLCSGKKWEEIYDILAIRILLESEEDCFQVAGLIHSKYQQIPSRYKDYINNPKENTYQSLHTTIIGSDKKIYEIQLRTRQMNINAEKGTASHLLYKMQKKNHKKVIPLFPKFFNSQKAMKS